jgi:hypothetical protein
MPVITACPDCGRKLRVPDELQGKKVRCPGCKVIFTAGAVEETSVGGTAPTRRAAPREESFNQPPARRSPPPPRESKYEEDRAEDRNDDDPDDLPRGKRLHEDDVYGNENVIGPRGNLSDWHKVSLGLVLILVSIVVGIIIPFVAAASGAVIGAMAAGSAGPPAGRPMANPMALRGARGGFLALTVFVALLQAANSGLKCYGHYLGTAVPDKPGTRLKMWALTTFGLFCASAALSISGSVVDIATGVGNTLSANPFATIGGGLGTVPMMIAAAFNLIGFLCYMAGYVVFILYCRAVALAVRHRDLANTLKIFLISVCSVTTVLFVMGAIAVTVLGLAFLSAGPGSGPISGAGGGPAPGQMNAALGGMMATGGLFCLGGLAYLGLGIWYIILLIQLRFAVVAFARPG